MRKALNENPLVQVALLGVLGLIVGFLLITRVSSGGSAPAPATEPGSPPAAPVASPDPAAASAAAATPGEAAGVQQAPVGSRAEFTAGAGLPAKVVDAYEAGKAVVVLIVHREGFEDRELESQVGSAGVGDAAVFVVEAEHIADYSRIAEGVDVDRVPALVVIEPKSRADGALPEASVSYGYRGPESVGQAVRDALYKGPEDLPYHPQ